MVFLAVCDEELWGEVVGSADYGSVLGHVADAYCGAGSDIADLKEQRILLENQNIGRLDIPMGKFDLLQMHENIKHRSNKIKNLILAKILLLIFPMLQELLQIRNTFLHLYIAFTAFEMILFLKTVTSPILDDIGMRVEPKLAEKFYLLPEYEFAHVVLESYLLHAFDIAMFVLDFVDVAIASADYFLALYEIFLV